MSFADDCNDFLYTLLCKGACKKRDHGKKGHLSNEPILNPNTGASAEITDSVMHSTFPVNPDHTLFIYTKENTSPNLNLNLKIGFPQNITTILNHAEIGPMIAERTVLYSKKAWIVFTYLVMTLFASASTAQWASNASGVSKTAATTRIPAEKTA